MKNLTLVLAAIAAPAAVAAPITLENGNASAVFSDTFDESGGFFQSGWIVDGVSQLAAQAFSVRVGLTGASTLLASITPTSVIVSDTGFDFLDDTLVVTYAFSGLSIETRYELAGGTAGSGLSTLNEVITITNTTGAALDLSFFQFADFDLGGTSLDASLDILGGNTVRQVDGNGTFFGEESVLTPAPSNSQVGNTFDVFDAVASGSLDGSTSASNGDLAWAFQFDFLSLGAGDSVVISKKKSILPTPGTAALLAAGGLMGARRRRR